MPLPKPNAGESRADFMDRCLKDPATQDITGDTAEATQSRRVAACERQFDDARKSDSGELELKTFGALAIKNVATGEVEAVVATLNVVDKDGDVILPGAVKGDAPVKMSGYGHDVILDGAAPAGKGIVKEVGNTLRFYGRFFLSTERGREAFNIAKELGPDGEWSFGFPPVQRAEMTREWAEKAARRLIAGIRPTEVSQVFQGAGIGTRTVSVKRTAVAQQDDEVLVHARQLLARLKRDPALAGVFPQAKAPAPTAEELAHADRLLARLRADPTLGGIIQTPAAPPRPADLQEWIADYDAEKASKRALDVAVRRWGIRERPLLKWFKPNGRCLGQFLSDRTPCEIWIAVKQTPEESAHTTLHEAWHAFQYQKDGICSEAGANLIAGDVLREERKAILG